MPEIIERRGNWAPWLAFLLVLIAIGLNAAFFLRVPGQRVIPGLSLLLAFAALACGMLGIKRAFGQPQAYGGKVSSSIFGVLALLACGLLIFGWFQARSLPASARAPHVGEKAPDFILTDTEGRKISLAQLLGHGDSSGASSTTTGGAAPKAVLLIFYRGYW